MKISLCNEVVRELPFERQCALAAELGYQGLEIAPFTLSDEPHLMPSAEIARLRRTAESAGIAVSSLHWLLVAPAGLSITSHDAALRRRTVEVMRRLVGMAAELGAEVLVHGSPAQRLIGDGPDPQARLGFARECLAAAAEAAAVAGVTYCLEPLARRETDYVNTVAEAVRVVEEIGNPHLRTMVDTSAAAVSEAEPVAELLDRWLPTGMIAHVQVNDRNRRGPGQGSDRFAPVFAALRRHGWERWVAVEPFDYLPDGPTTAARSIGYIRGILETLP